MSKTADPRFISPMLATATTILPRGSWVAERKEDGHRLIIDRPSSDVVVCWSRLGNRREQDLNHDLLVELSRLPLGTYDGELVVPGGVSTDVTDHANRSKLRVVLFDVLRDSIEPLMIQPWSIRRKYLEKCYASRSNWSRVTISSLTFVKTWDEVQAAADRIWDEGGEGLILKDTTAPYRAGKRTKVFLKIKECNAAVTTILGFAQSEGEVMSYGLYGTAVVRDADGVVVPVKVLDDETREKLSHEGRAAADAGVALHTHTVRLLSGKKVTYWTGHPWVGRKLGIEYQVRTVDGSYRHPRWDHLV